MYGRCACRQLYKRLTHMQLLLMVRLLKEFEAVDRTLAVGLAGFLDNEVGENSSSRLRSSSLHLHPVLVIPQHHGLHILAFQDVGAGGSHRALLAIPSQMPELSAIETGPLVWIDPWQSAILGLVIVAAAVNAELPPRSNSWSALETGSSSPANWPHGLRPARESVLPLACCAELLDHRQELVIGWAVLILVLLLAELR